MLHGFGPTRGLPEKTCSCPLPRACLQSLGAGGKQKPLSQGWAHEMSQTLPAETQPLSGPPEGLTFSGSRLSPLHPRCVAAWCIRLPERSYMIARAGGSEGAHGNSMVASSLSQKCSRNCRAVWGQEGPVLLWL